MPLLYDWLQSAVRERGSASAASALVYRDTYLSWRGLAHRVDRRAQDLRALGIGPGAWVGVMLGNVPDFVILALALSKLRAVMVPLDPTTSTRDLDMILEVAPLRALITRPRGGDSLGGTPGALRVSERPASPRFVPESRRRVQGTLLACNLYRRDPPALDPGVEAAVVLFTLDVGGDPKGVVRTEAELAAIAEAVGSTLDLDADDRMLCTAPLHHGYGFDMAVLGALAHGTSLVLEEETVVPRVAKLVRDGEVDVLLGTPTGYGALARLPVAKPVKVKRPRFVSSGSALPANVADTFHRKYGVRLLSCYHSTEAGPVSIESSGKEPLTVGEAFAGVELRVATADERDLPVGTTGPIWVRSGAVARASVPRLPAALRATGVPVGRASSEGWFRTGDLGYVDRQGKLLLTGREDDLVKVEGRRVALGEVEGCLEALAQVREAEVRVVMDEFGWPRVVARVVPSGHVKPEELIDHCARMLAPYKVPRQIEITDHLA
jgi:long-chain acyl-CoA synthetase